MLRVMRYVFALCMMLTAGAAALAQPAGGGASPTLPDIPQLPEGFPQSAQDLEALFTNPDSLQEIVGIIGAEIQKLLDEHGDEFNALRANFERALHSDITRGMAVVFGLLMLVFPQKLRAITWLFVGAILGYIFSQMPESQSLRLDMASSDFDFMLKEPEGSLTLTAMGAFFGLVVLSPLSFFALTALFSLAAGVILTALLGDNAALTPLAMGGGALLGLTLGGLVVARSMLLITLAVGAALLTFGAGLSPTFILPLMVGGLLFSVARSPEAKKGGKRSPLPSLDLQDGKVNLNRNDSKPEKHLHEILPEMADDRDSPLIRR